MPRPLSSSTGPLPLHLPVSSPLVSFSFSIPPFLPRLPFSLSFLIFSLLFRSGLKPLGLSFGRLWRASRAQVSSRERPCFVITRLQVSPAGKPKRARGSEIVLFHGLTAIDLNCRGGWTFARVLTRAFSIPRERGAKTDRCVPNENCATRHPL